MKQLAVPVLAHRLTLKADSILRGVQPAPVVNDMLRQVAVGAEELN